MGRPLRVTEPGLVYHVLNRRVMRLPLSQKDDGCLAFDRLLFRPADVGQALLNLELDLGVNGREFTPSTPSIPIPSNFASPRRAAAFPLAVCFRVR